MPYNGNGVFGVLNVFLPGTTILSTPMNSNFSDIAAGLTDCLTRDGQAGMTAQLKAIAGTVGAPGISFTNDLTTGLYLSNTGELSFSAAGVRQAMLNSTSFIRTTAIVDNGTLSAPSLSTSQNNYGPTGIDSSSTIVLTLSANINITGLAGQADGTAAVNGRKMVIVNTASGFAATLVANSSSSIAGNRFAFQANVILYSGQTIELIKLGNGWNITGTYQFISNTPLGNCQLRLGSSTTVTLFPYQGNQVAFPSGAIATIGSSGITSTFNNASVNGTSGQTLSNTTLYYAYLWDSGSGVYVIDWSTTSHATDTTTGIEIKSGDATRVLVGMAYLVGGNFLDANANRLVASWFNRSRKTMQGSFTTNRTTTSSTPVEINTEIRCNFLTWGDSLNAMTSGTVQCSNNNSLATSTLVLDANSSTLGTMNGFRHATLTEVSSGIVGGNISPSEGFHFLTLYGAILLDTGTVTWTSGYKISGTIVN